MNLEAMLRNPIILAYLLILGVAITWSLITGTIGLAKTRSNEEFCWRLGYEYYVGQPETITIDGNEFIRCQKWEGRRLNDVWLNRNWENETVN